MLAIEGGKKSTFLLSSPKDHSEIPVELAAKLHRHFKTMADIAIKGSHEMKRYTNLGENVVQLLVSIFKKHKCYSLFITEGYK